jgi:hypothetical protein
LAVAIAAGDEEGAPIVMDNSKGVQSSQGHLAFECGQDLTSQLWALWSEK